MKEQYLGIVLVTRKFLFLIHGLNPILVLFACDGYTGYPDYMIFQDKLLEQPFPDVSLYSEFPGGGIAGPKPQGS